MVLSDRQKIELNSAIAEYLKVNHYSNSLREFTEEAKVVAVPSSNRNDNVEDLLEKKWMSVVRLQRKITELETRMCQMEAAERENELYSQQKNDHGDTEQTANNFSWAKKRPTQSLLVVPVTPEKFKIRGHRGPVTQVAFHPCYSFLASASEDSSIKMWDYESGELERSLKGHTDTVNDIQFQPGQGRILVSCSSDQTIRIWDLQSFDTLKTLRGHDHSVHSIRFFPNDTNLMASCSRDKSVKVWDVSSGFCLKTLSSIDSKWVRRLCISEDGAYFATCGDDLVIKIWPSYSTTSSDYQTSLSGHSNTIEALEWIPLEKGEQQRLILSGSRDKTISCWDALNGICLYTLNEHGCWVQAIRAFRTKDSLFFVSVSDDRSLIVWNGKKRSVSSMEGRESGLFYTANLDIHPKGTMIATGGADTIVKLWNCRR